MNEKKEFNQELKKIRIEHLQQSMLDSIKELRFIDRSVIIFSGLIWAFIFQSIDDISIFINSVIQCIIFITPFIVSLLLAIKASTLYARYKIHKSIYEGHLKDVIISEIDKKYCSQCSNKIKSKSSYLNWDKVGINLLSWLIVIINFLLFCVVINIVDKI